MTNNTPSGTEKHRESTKQESRHMVKMVFFLLLLLLAQNNSISIDQCTSPSPIQGFCIKDM